MSPDDLRVIKRVAAGDETKQHTQGCEAGAKILDFKAWMEVFALLQ